MNEKHHPDILAALAVIYGLDDGVEIPPPPVFFPPGCVTFPKWEQRRLAAQQGLRWSWTAAEIKHFGACDLCGRQERSFAEYVPASQGEPPVERCEPRRPWVSRCSVVASLTAACLLVGVGVWVLVRGGSDQPPSFSLTHERSQAAMGAGNTPIADRLTWQLPGDLGGYLAALELSPDGHLEARPGPSGECQVVDSPRSSPAVKINLLFSPSSRGNKTVWVFLTAEPANKVLAKLTNELSADAKSLTTERIFDALKANKVAVRAVGQHELPAADAPSKQ